MINLYSNMRDHSDICSLDWDDTNKELLRIPYTGIIDTPREGKELDDLMHDYLFCEISTYQSIRSLNTAEDKEVLRDAGYDLNLEHWASIECVYLPFIHFLYISEGWII